MPTVRLFAALAPLLVLVAPLGPLQAAESHEDLVTRAQADPRLSTFVTAVEAGDSRVRSAAPAPSPSSPRRTRPSRPSPPAPSRSCWPIRLPWRRS